MTAAKAVVQAPPQFVEPADIHVRLTLPYDAPRKRSPPMPAPTGHAAAKTPANTWWSWRRRRTPEETT